MKNSANTCKYMYLWCGWPNTYMKMDIYTLTSQYDTKLCCKLDFWDHGLQKWVSSHGVRSIQPSKWLETLEIGAWSLDVGARESEIWALKSEIETGSWKLGSAAPGPFWEIEAGAALRGASRSGPRDRWAQYINRYTDYNSLSYLNVLMQFMVKFKYI